MPTAGCTAAHTPAAVSCAKASPQTSAALRLICQRLDVSRGTISVSFCMLSDLRRYVTFCMARVELLRNCGVVPVLVFDGANLPIKGEEEGTRRR